jgi:hypothetical protein
VKASFTIVLRALRIRDIRFTERADNKVALIREEKIGMIKNCLNHWQIVLYYLEKTVKIKQVY